MIEKFTYIDPANLTEQTAHIEKIKKGHKTDKILVNDAGFLIYWRHLETQEHLEFLVPHEWIVESKTRVIKKTNKSHSLKILCLNFEEGQKLIHLCYLNFDETQVLSICSKDNTFSIFKYSCNRGQWSCFVKAKNQDKKETIETIKTIANNRQWLKKQLLESISI